MSNNDFARLSEIKEDNGNQLRLKKLEKLEDAAFVDASNPSKIATIDTENFSQKKSVDEAKVVFSIEVNLSCI